MRVTNKMMSQTVLNNLTTNLNRLQKLQDQMSSGHVISRPSDDPVIASRVMALNSTMKQHDQYERNINDAIGWLETTDKALGSLNDALQRVRELTIKGSNSSLSATDRNALAQEVEQLFGNVVQIANTSYANRYIFAGTKTTAAPFSQTGAYSGNSGPDGQMNWEVSQGVNITINIDGNDAFINPEIFDMLNDIKSDMLSGNINQLSTTELARLDAAIENTLNCRAEIGAKSNRLEMALNRSGEETLNYQSLQSKLNDIDIAKVITEFKMQENVYQSALMTSTRIIQPSLVNFLS